MGAYYNQGISDTPRILAKGTLVHHHKQQGAAICTTGGSGQAEGEGGCPPSTANRSSYSQSSLCSSKARGRLEANNRFEVPQYRHGTTSFQNGGPVYAAQHGESGMAYGKIRPKRRILDHPYCPRVLESSYFSSWPSTSTDAVPVSPIRALHRSICLFKGHKANNPIPTPVRNPSDKYPEVYHDPDLLPGIPRICSGYRSNDSIPSNAQDSHHYERCNPPSSEGIDASERPGGAHRNISSNQASGMDWAPSLSGPTRLKDTSTPSAPILSDIDKPVIRGENRSPVVALRPESQLLSNDCETRSLDSHRVRRLDVRLGSCLPGSNNWWQMDVRRGWFTHQLVRAPSDFSGFAILFEGQNQLVGFGQIRQSHRYSLLEQDGQPHKIPALPASSGDLGMVSSPSDLSSHRILGRKGQCFGRLGIPSSRQQRLATPAISLRGSPPPPRSLYNRSFCEQNEYTAASLLQLETRPTGESGRCLFNIMVARSTLPSV